MPDAASRTSRLVGIPVRVSASVDKHGHKRAAHTRIQQVRMKTEDGRTARFNRALIMATQAHAGQVRKSTDIPYITHPVAVSELIRQYGGDEDQAIAGLLHDVLEDGGPQYREPIKAQFGRRVLGMVEACTDSMPDATGRKPPWKERKVAYLNHLADSPNAALLVSACDKLHNLQAILSDRRAIGDKVFDRFTASKSETLWYYGELVATLADRVPANLAQALRASLKELQAA